MVDITFLENTQLNEYRVLVRICSACQLRLLIDIEQSFELGLRWLIPFLISSFCCFQVCQINGACSARARTALSICVRHVVCTRGHLYVTISVTAGRRM